MLPVTISAMPLHGAGIFINSPNNHPHVNNWLVVSTPMKNISQLGSLFPLYGK
jgi:hypothetical protein